MSDFPKLPAGPHKHFYEQMRNEYNLSEEDCDFMHRRDDIFVDTDTIHSTVTWLMEDGWIQVPTYPIPAPAPVFCSSHMLGTCVEKRR